MSFALHDQLISLLAERSTKVGEFTLASGRKSDLYIDARLTTMSPEGLFCIGQLGHELICQTFPAAEAIGGLTLGADPLAYAIAMYSARSPRPLRAFTVRKEPKTHGTRQQVEGPVRTGDRVVIIEDVLTTGGSAIHAIAAVQSAGMLVQGVLVLVDREEGGKTNLEQRGLRVLSMTTAAELRVRLGTVQSQ